jgi:phosphatidylglycerophosphate synthase
VDDAGPVGEAEDPVAGWERLHGEDVSGNRLAGGWIRLMHRIARVPLVRSASPDVLTVCGVLCAAASVLVAAQGRQWPLLAVALIVVAALFDGLDGAVALRSGKVRPLGAVLDAVADRVSDLCLLGVLVALGADARWCAALGAATLLHEYARARAQAAGMASAGAITVIEKPTRVILAALACAGAAIVPSGPPGLPWSWAVVFAGAWTVCAMVGAVQLVIGLRRALGTA